MRHGKGVYEFDIQVVCPPNTIGNFSDTYIPVKVEITVRQYDVLGKCYVDVAVTPKFYNSVFPSRWEFTETCAGNIKELGERLIKHIKTRMEYHAEQAERDIYLDAKRNVCSHPIVNIRGLETAVWEALHRALQQLKPGS